MSEMDILSLAIDAVKTNEISFCKFISANDAGSTGGHQSGIYVPKNSIPLIFDEPGVKGINKERIVQLDWHDGTSVQCCFKYYGTGTRNEYRITRLGKSFEEGDLVVIIRVTEDHYLGFIFFDEILIDLFLEEFELLREETNSLIQHEVLFEQSDYKDDIVVKTEELLPESIDFDTYSVNFKPKAHILTLLGEELIKDPVMAIYELVKNSYDADAKFVNVYFNQITNLEEAEIIIVDSGIGITEDVLCNVWLEPGTAYRKPIDENGKRSIVRSPIFGRVPMGEKGVGRFAVHKLGEKIKLISRPSQIQYDASGNYIGKRLLNYEINLEIDWQLFTQAKYLSDVVIEYKKNTDPESFYFKEDSGTYIKVSSLKESWNRGMARKLKRHTLSMVSPKNDPQKFSISLNFNNNWLDRFPEINELLDCSPYKLTAILDKNYNLTFEYEFKLVNNTTIGSREIKGSAIYDKNILGSLRPIFRNYYENRDYDPDKIETLLQQMVNDPIPYGDLMVEIYSYDLDSKSLKDITYSPDILKKTLKEQHGIKVFKGDLRVYDYGEPGNDWLGLDNRRVNDKEWFSNNQNIGFIYLNPEDSGPLIEKTNREGFISNEAFDHFHLILGYLLTQFKIERNRDRNTWIKLNKENSGKSSFKERVSNFVSLINNSEMDESDRKQRLLEEASKIESDYDRAQETLLLPAGVGMTASVALHEIEKLVPRMEETVSVDPINTSKIQDQVEELDGYVSGILTVLQQAGTKPVSVEQAIRQALINFELRLNERGIQTIVQIDSDVDTVNCDKRYLIMMLINLIDNSIYWFDTIYSDNKKIQIKATKKQNATSIIFADNGPGFTDSPEEIVTPFFSRKDGGIGIGMYIIDTIMMKYGKLKIYTENSFSGVDNWEQGAIVELVFNKKQE